MSRVHKAHKFGLCTALVQLREIKLEFTRMIDRKFTHKGKSLGTKNFIKPQVIKSELW